MKECLYPLADLPPAKKAELVQVGPYRPYLVNYGNGKVAIVGAIDPLSGVVLQSVSDDDEGAMYAFNKVGHILRFVLAEIRSITPLSSLPA